MNKVELPDNTILQFTKQDLNDYVKSYVKSYVESNSFYTYKPYSDLFYALKENDFNKELQDRIINLDSENETLRFERSKMEYVISKNTDYVESLESKIKGLTYELDVIKMESKSKSIIQKLFKK